MRGSGRVASAEGVARITWKDTQREEKKRGKKDIITTTSYEEGPPISK
jgi:hypothetical protein